MQPVRTGPAPYCEVSTVSGDAQLAKLRDIGGLDVEQGLCFMAGNQPLYLAMLQRLITGYHDAADRIAAALAMHSDGDAERIAHTTKGICAGVGESIVSRQAGLIEQAIHDRWPDTAVRPLLEAMQVDLLVMVTALRRRLESPVHRAPDIWYTPGEVETTVAKLRDLLASDDAGTICFLEQNEPAICLALGNRYPALRRSIATFNFDEALTLL